MVQPIRPEFAPYVTAKDPLPRAIAAEILSNIACLGESGNYPDDIPPYLVGRAIARLVSNYRACDGLDEGKIFADFNEGLAIVPRSREYF